MRLKTVIRFPVDIRKARKWLAEKTVKDEPFSQRPIVLDLQTEQLLFDCGRHLSTLARFAASIDSAFSIRCSPLLLAAIGRKIHGRELLADTHAEWISPESSIPENAFVLSDRPALGATVMLIGKTIHRDIPVMPYPMHPATFLHAADDQLRKLRANEERGFVAFIGNQKPKYGHPKMNRNFGITSRLDLISALRDQFAGHCLDNVPVRLTDTKLVIADGRSAKIKPESWLPTLSRFSFFVCCPGAAQPTCHHLTEAMSVGTIPILEYSDRTTPMLQDGVNAICFHGASGLINAIHRIGRMPRAEVRAISLRAASYYDQHMRGEEFLRKLRDNELDNSKRMICMPFHEHDFYAPDETRAKVAA